MVAVEPSMRRFTMLNLGERLLGYGLVGGRVVGVRTLI